MIIETEKLYQQLSGIVENSLEKVKGYKSLEMDQLNFKKDADTWSILECIEHLNLYGDFYLPEIQKQILADKKGDPPINFKSGVLGNYFANTMLIKNGKVNKMKSPKDKNPANSRLTKTTLDRFIKQQELLTSLLSQSRNVDLTRVKTGISLTPFIRIKLGDTFRFFIYHIDRHIAQAQKINDV